MFRGGMAATAAPGNAKDAKAREGLHIPQGQRINFNYGMSDGASQWDIQYYGSIGQGTNYIFSGAYNCQLNGNTVPSTGQGWLNKAGDQVEVGTQNWNNLNISRRIKVYKEQGLALAGHLREYLSPGCQLPDPDL